MKVPAASALRLPLALLSAASGPVAGFDASCACLGSLERVSTLAACSSTASSFISALPSSGLSSSCTLGRLARLLREDISTSGFSRLG
eukprot:CAMPEP_0177792492 /NCGR_PEP_ID=MMETSP0491_2-20121128/24555_1 /TAXON_ID=63592 /ORGANISM="Tetraselmis chuii, Strain PLY429" /LENGTH=87 /DNA_ID=CAMNT_0019314913 /DNA_START=2376 /DNA_END=2639 /DNA_ORIENTATION=+